MFVKLTKMDGSPLWVNANYVVTVEPSRTGGAVVVPLGDGLDYDVRETPEEVMALVAGEASAPKRAKVIAEFAPLPPVRRLTSWEISSKSLPLMT